MSKNKVLVTGGLGFIGGNLIPILEQNDYQVNVLDNLSSGSDKNLKDSKANIIHGDIRNKNDLSKAISDCSTVIHLAALGSVTDSVLSPEENFEINVMGTFNVLNESRLSSVSNLIFSSTGGALMGDTEPPVNELSLPSPISPYGSGKLCGESYCSSFSKVYNMNITALRFANVIGPLSWHKKGAVTTFMKEILSKNALKIYGDGNATRDFLYVNDLCNGILLTLKSKLKGYNILHLSSGHEVSINKLAHEIINSSGINNVPIKYFERRAGEVERNFADYSLAKKLIGYEPKISFESAIKSTWDWFKDYSDKNR
jgi:UDP-glucose 4-epimerase